MTWHAISFIGRNVIVLAALAFLLVVIWFIPHRGWIELRERFGHRIHHPILKRHFASDEPSLIRALISLAVVIAGLSMFVRTFRGVMHDPRIAGVDLRLHNTLRLFHSIALHRFYSSITVLAGTTVVLPVVIALCVVFWFTGREREAAALGVAWIGATIAGVTLKYLVDRPRPVEARALVRGPSFPSGHTLVAIAVYGFVAYLLIRSERRSLRHVIAALALAVYVAYVPISRVYLGVHWPFDAVASLELGAAWLMIVILLYRYPPIDWLAERQHARSLEPWSSALMIVLLIVAVFASVRPRPRAIPQLGPDGQHVVQLTTFPLRTKTSEDLAGGPMEPASFLFVGSDRDLIDRFERAGWSLAETPSMRGLAKELLAVIRDAPDPTGPATPSYFATQPQDLTFEKSGAPNGSVRRRHHIRIWRSPICVEPCTPVWVATCSYDEGVKFVPKPYLITHRISPNIDAEREFIAMDLRGAGARDLSFIAVTGPTRGKNAGADEFFTDGRAHVMLLR
jgi:membrane-associated phospholipid phosphatase